MRQDDRVSSNDRENFSNKKTNNNIDHIKRDNPNYILPNHYYTSNYQLLDILEDQLSPKGFSVYSESLILKYLYGVDGKTNTLKRCKKAKYYLDELIMFREKNPLPNIDDRVEETALHPEYFRKGNIEVINILDDQCEDEEALTGFYVGMCIRYVMRNRHKNGLEDLKKAKYYLDRFINKLGEDRES